MTDNATLTAADAFRHWSAPAPGTITPGSDMHNTVFCRMLLDTHNPHKPAVIDWPPLDDDARGRLVGLPIWDIAVQTEGKAKIRAQTYAESIPDPLLRQAITLDGFEEGRHKEVLSKLVSACGIALAPEPAYLPARHPEWAWMALGFSECIDSFFAFGLFAAAKQSEFFPPELVETFDPVIQEEARHILILCQLGRLASAQFALVAAAVVLDKNRRGLDPPGARAHRACPRDWRRGGRKAAGQQLHADRRQGGSRYRPAARGAHRHLPCRERPPHDRLRPAPHPPDGGAAAGAVHSPLHAHPARPAPGAG